jgi:hypothetical protein
MTRELFLRLITLAIVPAFAPEAHGQKAPTPKLFDMGGVTVTLPPGVKAEKRRGPDFDLFYFATGVKDAKGKPRQILFAYIGFAPSFPNTAPKGTPQMKEMANGYSARTCRWKTKGGGVCCEALVSTGRTDWAKYVHFVYTDLTAAEAKAAEEIIASVRTVSLRKAAHGIIESGERR